MPHPRGKSFTKFSPPTSVRSPVEQYSHLLAWKPSKFLKFRCIGTQKHQKTLVIGKVGVHAPYCLAYNVIIISSYYYPILYVSTRHQMYSIFCRYFFDITKKRIYKFKDHRHFTYLFMLELNESSKDRTFLWCERVGRLIRYFVHCFDLRILQWYIEILFYTSFMQEYTLELNSK